MLLVCSKKYNAGKTQKKIIFALPFASFQTQLFSDGIGNMFHRVV